MTQLVEYRPVEQMRPRDGMKGRIALGAFMIVTVFGGLGTWSATASLDGAVIASGFMQVESNHKAIQHLEGGIVAEILVREGDHVNKGDLLIRLHDKATSANLRLVQGQIAELTVRRARLIAEREGRDTLKLPDDLSVSDAETKLTQIVEGQKALLEARWKSRLMEVTLLREQQKQLRTQIEGMKERKASILRQIAFYDDELQGLRKLYKKGLTPKSRLLALERAAETNRGELATLTSDAAAAEMKIRELELEILRLHSSMQEKIADELRTVEAEMNAVAERLVSTEDEVERTEIRSPRTGRVYQLAVHAPGAVIGPGETIMEIVPESDTLVVGAQVVPHDIDKVESGAAATIRLSSFNRRATPELTGEVTHISADLVTDKQTGQGYYAVTVSIPPNEIKRLAGLKLKPGMPAETLIRTGERTPLSYLLKPLTDSFARALTEE